MMKTLVILTLFLSSIFANSKIYNAYALAIYDELGNKEIIHNKRVTSKDYNGFCISEIFVNSTKSFTLPKVTIGTSIGHFVSNKPFYKDKIKIGEIIKFKHFAVKKGYLTISIDNKIYDRKVFIK